MSIARVALDQKTRSRQGWPIAAYPKSLVTSLLKMAVALSLAVSASESISITTRTCWRMERSTPRSKRQFEFGVKFAILATRAVDSETELGRGLTKTWQIDWLRSRNCLPHPVC